MHLLAAILGAIEKGPDAFLWFTGLVVLIGVGLYLTVSK
jgi:hypothetical protein